MRRGTVNSVRVSGRRLGQRSYVLMSMHSFLRLILEGVAVI